MTYGSKMSNKIIENSKDDDTSWSIVQYDLKDDFKSIIWNSWVKPLIFVDYSNFVSKLRHLQNWLKIESIINIMIKFF